MALRVKPAVCDVFSVKLNQSQMAFGQVLAVFEDELYLVVFFDISHDTSNLSVDAVVASKPLLVGHTFDAKIVNGDWQVIGNMPPDRSRFPFPKYKVGSGSNCYIEAFDGTKCRLANAEEEQLLTFRRATSPQVFEEAIKDHFGLFDWSRLDEKQRSRFKASFSALNADIALRSASIK